MSHVPHWVYHFTRIEHLPTIIQHGLLSDALAASVLQVEIGNRGIKGQRARRLLPVAPGGVVADYAPFHYAPRSPMMFAIHRGNVPSYSEGCERLIYLVTSVERLHEAGLRVLGTDRNAALEIAKFANAPAEILRLVDWPLMRAQYWANTEEDPDRRERRQAECLVHENVPWEVISDVAAKTEVGCRRAASRPG
jgi:hypothetical protein